MRSAVVLALALMTALFGSSGCVYPTLSFPAIISTTFDPPQYDILKN
ncbi:MAG: hypothetical protein H7A46_03460 [Verrucomicrobiales bacterium]|nr:hypothetical protein [Verrucomicrobiales bacterium]